MDKQQAVSIIEQLINTALKAGIFHHVKDINVVQQAFEVLKGSSDVKELAQLASV